MRAQRLADDFPTLPDYLREGLDIVSIGINPSVNSVRAGYYFATPRNRFWAALNASGLVPVPVTPGKETVERLFHEYGIGFTDVVKRPASSAGQLGPEDFRRWAPLLRERLLRFRPRIAWFHGLTAYRSYLLYGEGRREQPKLLQSFQPSPVGSTRAFVTPNPSPANAAFSLEVLTGWYRRLKQLRDEVVGHG
ncbi:MAG: mismatch-specific DNA-glycosylase [Chloroflexi bacterium]|nr:mismatch-specific DNA-glycosylase [Chloroflexota bacterium]